MLAAVFAIAIGCGGADAEGPRRRGTAGQGGGGAGENATSGSGGEDSASGSGGAAGTAGAGGSLPQAGTDTMTGGDLGLHVEDAKAIEVDVVTVSCVGECVEVTAVAKGGNPPYAFTWDDGSSDVTRTLCPDADTTFTVTVTDTEVVDSEFSMPQQQASANVAAKVLECPTTPPDAGAGAECEMDSDCGAGQVCFEQTCVGDGGLRFSLTWNVDTDFDLMVRLPDGRTTINYIITSAQGGMLDVDDCFQSCRRPGGPHVENIHFPMDAPRGTYTYWVSNAGVTMADDFALEVSVAGTVQAMQSGNIPEFRLESPRYTFEL